MENEDEFSLGSVEETPVSVESNPVSAVDSVKLPRPDIDEFYVKLVQEWRDGKCGSYEVFLQQGNVAAAVLYGILGLKPFQTPSDSDVARLEIWKNEWINESERFQKIDLAKKEDLVDAIGTLIANFTNKKRNEQFAQVLKQATWGRLTPLITEKCSDGIIEPFEMAGILNTARELGLLTEDLRKETMDNILNQIKSENSVIQTIPEAFKAFYDKYVAQNSLNEIDNEANQNNLFEKYAELKNLENQINDSDEPATKENFRSFLDASGIKLKSSVEVFKTDYFSKFAKEHDLTAKLSNEDFSTLKAVACSTYGLTVEQWTAFKNENKIDYDKAVSQTQLDDIQNQIANLAEQNKILAAQKDEIARRANEEILAAQTRNQIVQQKTEPQARVSRKSRLASLLLCFFFGMFGVQRFYVGKTKTGILMLVLTVLGSITAGVTTVLAYIWSIIDFIMICVGSFKDSSNLPVKNWSSAN